MAVAELSQPMYAFGSGVPTVACALPELLNPAGVRSMQDTVNAFIEIFTVQGASDGPLKGLTVGIKDIYDIAGHMTGCGSPDWARTHEVASEHAPCVAALLDAGATVVGKTHTDELAYSLLGINAHYGTPTNTKAPDRVPGGSSSGSVAATAAGLVDIGLGSDTGGSVRMPASFCGLFGIRPTHGRIDISGAMPMAPSFDTVGWFARDTDTFAKGGLAYGIESPASVDGTKLMIADDAMAFALPETRAAIQGTIDKLQEMLGAAGTVSLADGAFDRWRNTFRVCQGAEVWESHGAWVTEAAPSFGPGIKDRFRMASELGADEIAAARAQRADIRARLVELIGDRVIVLPTSPGPAPFRDVDDAQQETFRSAALGLLCSAGLAGLPQVNIPAGIVDGGPVGVSLLGGPGRDGLLIAIARNLMP